MEDPNSLKKEEEKTLPNSRKYYLDSENYPEHQNLVKAGYYFSVSSELKDVISDKPYVFNGKFEYDKFSALVISFVQALMVKHFGFTQLFVPSAEDNNGVPGPVNIFISPDFDTNTSKCLVIIQGTGDVRAGIWGRSCCINGSLEIGSMLPYLKKAKEKGYSVIVLNPNIHFDSKGLPVKFHKEMHDHCCYVWQTIVPFCRAKHLCIVTHSAGGYCCYKLIKTFGKQFMGKIKAIAVVDTTMEPGDTEIEKRYIKETVMQFQASEAPLGTPIKMHNDLMGVSAGHTEHEYAPGAAIDQVFEYLDILSCAN